MPDELTPNRGLTKKVKSSMTRQRAALEKSRREVLDTGAKYLKPLGLARHKVVKLTLSVLIGLAVTFFIAVTSLIYFVHSDSAFIYSVSRIVPFPVARVNGRFVSYADYAFEVRYRKNIYSNPSGPESATNQPVNFKDAASAGLLHQIQHDSLNQAKLEAITKAIAKTKNISVSGPELDKAVNDLVAANGGIQQFTAAIKQYYGWSLDDFRRVYYIQLLQQKLAVVLLPQVSQSQLAEAQNLLAQAQSGADFAALAQANSQDDGTKASGGDVGFVSATSPFVDQFKTAALALTPGQVSGIIITQFGFHILKATDKQGSQVRVSQILIKFSTDINTYLNQQLTKAKSINFIHLPAAPATSPAPAVPQTP